MSRACRLALGALLVAAGLPACAGIGTQELPSEPIALYWYDQETSRKRAEAIEDAQTGGPATRAGVAHVESITSYVEELAGLAEEEDPRSLDARFPGRLALLDPRSEEVTPVPGARDGAIPRAWSADRSRLLYTQTVRNYRQLTRGRHVHPDGCYLPDGRYVVARVRVEPGGAHSEIALADPGVTNLEVVSKSPNSYGPACAPDGSAIVWVVAGQRGRDTLEVQSPPGSGEVRSLGPGTDPSFSSDGEWIVYSAPSGRSSRLMRVRPDGSGRNAVGQSTLADTQPSLSPDGRLVVYVSDDGYNRRLYVRRWDGSGDRVLLRDGGAEHPVWQ